uniref:BC2-ORF2/A-HLG n=1 Tax=Giardia intestinalis TaxID=5741 RepID=Q9U053_GIAIN|nr:BC2-ORF2/A-HLG [Giardia intestinalis]
MGVSSMLTEFIRRQLPTELPQHIVIVADGTGRSSFQHNYDLFPCCLLQHIRLFVSFKIRCLSFVLYGLFSPNTSFDSRSKNLTTMKDALSDLLEYLKTASFLLYITVYGSYNHSRPNNIFLECLELMGSINELTERRSTEVQSKQMYTITLSIFVSYSSLSSLHDVSVKTCQENSTECMINSTVEPSSIALALSCYGIRPYPGITGEIYMSGAVGTVSSPSFTKCVATPLPPPDIFARTSGEKRIGDCFLWEIPLHKCMLLWNVHSFYKSPGPLRLLFIILKWSCFKCEQEALEFHISCRQSRYAHLKSARKKKEETSDRCSNKKISCSPCDDDAFESVSIFADRWECSSEKPEGTSSDLTRDSALDNASRGCFIYE